MAVGGVTSHRADTRASSHELTIAAAKTTLEFTLFLPEGRGKTPAAGPWLKLNLVPVFTGKLQEGAPRPDLFALSERVPALAVRAMPPPLVGVVELRI